MIFGFILLFQSTNILAYPVIKSHIMICNKCIGIKCTIHSLLSMYHHHHHFYPQCCLPFPSHLFPKFSHYIIKHLCHLLNSLKTFLKWVLGWITMLAYWKASTKLIVGDAIRDAIVPLLLILNLVLPCPHHKIHKSTNMLLIFNMRQSTRDICKLSRNERGNIS